MEMNEVWIKSAIEQFGFTQGQAEGWLALWATEHDDGDTALSYIDWLKHKIAAARDDLAPVANRALIALEVGVRIGDGATVRRDLANILSLVAPILAAKREQDRKE